MECINGCKASLIITVGRSRVAAGELDGQPGVYKVWASDLSDNALLWERTFDNLSRAAGLLNDAAFPKGSGQDE